MNINLDDPKTTVKRREIIKNKKYLFQVYKDFYEIFKKESQDTPKGKKIELGSGAGFLKDIIPDITTSDVMKLPFCDMHFSAEKMPFRNHFLAGIYMLNTFHHIKKPEKALFEFSRCLKKGGKVIMIEPYNSFLGNFIYKYFHHEEFNTKSDWESEGEGYLSSANGALPWIIFVRDRKKFERLFPRLKIVKVEPHTPFSYGISGGFNRKSFFPFEFYSIIKMLEKLLSPFNKQLGMFATIILKRV